MGEAGGGDGDEDVEEGGRGEGPPNCDANGDNSLRCKIGMRVCVLTNFVNLMRIFNFVTIADFEFIENLLLILENKNAESRAEFICTFVGYNCASFITMQRNSLLRFGPKY